MKTILLSLFLFCSAAMRPQCYVMAVAGPNHTMAIKSDGSLWGWGFNPDGQIGIGTTQTVIVTPVQIGTSTWKSVAPGQRYTLGVKTDGTLWGWGLDQYGQLGNSWQSSTVPMQIGSDTNWQSVAAGNSHSIALKTDGTLWSWGYNYGGQLGQGFDNCCNTVPAQIGTDADWASIYAGDWHTMAIKTNGTLWGWGDNSNGQLGDGTTVHKSSPVAIGAANDWQKITAGNAFSMGLKTNGTIWTWGNNTFGQLGNGTTTISTIPTQLGTATWKDCDSGDVFGLAVKTDGTLWSWGYNSTDNSASAIQAMSMSRHRSATTLIGNNVSGGDAHSMALTDSQLFGTGLNGDGELGNGNQTWTNVLVPLGCAQPLGQPQFDLYSKIIVYPNPANDFISLRLPANASVEKIIITDVTGKKIAESREITIDVRALDAGIYLLSANSGPIIWRTKFIKE